jgi:AmmeMemoRadiSam system protein B
MAGPSETLVRKPAVAGAFYPGEPGTCRARASEYLIGASAAQPPTRRWLGGVVPHAGWDYSGAIAGQTIATLARAVPELDVVVVFGAIHTRPPTPLAALDSFVRWGFPGDACEVADALRRQLSQHAGVFCVDDRFHQREWAIEVELPLVRMAWGQAAMLPVEVPPLESAVQVGRRTAALVSQANLRAVFLASSDLTHYGPSFGMTPAGIGPHAMDWMMDNDRRLIELVLKMQADAIVPEVRARLNACGAGAIAAMLGACRELGALQASLLRHANSYQTHGASAGQPSDNVVGYASIVVG